MKGSIRAGEQAGCARKLQVEFARIPVVIRYATEECVGIEIAQV
jgi:hypothetical protein